MTIKLILLPLVIWISLHAFSQEKTHSLENKGFSKPFLLIENKGQITNTSNEFVPEIRFVAEHNGIKIFIEDNKVHYQFEKSDFPKNLLNAGITHSKFDSEIEEVTGIYRLDMELVGSKAPISVKKESVSDYFENYYLGHCPEGILNVHAYEKITFCDVYPNIDWVVYIKNNSMKYDFVVKPGGKVDQIKIKYLGADKLALQENGDIKIFTPLGEIVEKAPASFQNKESVTSSFKIDNDQITFSVSSYDNQQTLVIDPDLIWATYYGSGQSDSGESGSTDLFGNVYLSGSTKSTTGIALGGHQMSYGGGTYDGFLVKFNSNGVRQWATYYGGNGTDYVHTTCTDPNGNVFIGGTTYSSNGISFNGHQSSRNGPYDAFLAKFNSNGVRQWGTFYGGSLNDGGYGSAADSQGNVYLSGFTQSSNAISSGGHQNLNGGNQDGFLVKFNPNGIRLWGTYYGGDQIENADDCAVDLNGNVYLTGATESTNGIEYNGHQNILGGGTDGYLVKFDSLGVRLWGTYYGGNTADWSNSCSSDLQGNVFIEGKTFSSNNISFNGHQNNLSASGDIFLVKFDSSGVRKWGTYYGGSDSEYAYGCSNDSYGNTFITGYTQSPDGIAFGGIQSTYGGATDGFLAKFDQDGILHWGTYYGGAGGDTGFGCMIDTSNNVYLAGGTGSSSSISYNGYQNVYAGAGDAFLVKINPCSTVYPQNVSVCDYYIFNGTTYNSSGSYRHYLTSVNGCDSILILNLTILNSSTGIDSQASCDSLTWIDGITYYSSTNTPTWTVSNTLGCDSTVILNLTILNTSSIDLRTECDSLIWIDGNTYYSSTNTPAFVLQNTAGCDSTVILNLTIKNSTTGTDFQTVCNSYSWIDGNTYYSSTNTPTFVLSNSVGCDSIVTLNLTVNNSTVGIDPQTACGSFEWIDGITYTNSTNLPTWVIPNANNCDSTINLNLTIYPNPIVTVSNNGNGTLSTTAIGSYQWIRCSDFSTITNANSNSYTPSVNGTYAVIVDNGICADTSNCLYVNNVGLPSFNLFDAIVFPSPTSNLVTVSFDGNQADLVIYDAQGKLIQTSNIVSGGTVSLKDVQTGVYFFELTTENGKTVKRVVKN